MVNIFKKLFLSNIFNLVLFLIGLLTYFTNFLFIEDVYFIYIGFKYECISFSSFKAFGLLFFFYDLFVIFKMIKFNRNKFLNNLKPNFTLFGTFILLLLLALIFKVGHEERLLVAIWGLVIAYLQTVVFHYEYVQITSKHPFNNKKSQLSIVSFGLLAIFIGIIVTGDLPTEKDAKRKFCTSTFIN